MQLKITIEEDGKPLATVDIDEDDWQPSESGTYDIAYSSSWIAVPDRWGYQLSLHLQRPPKEVRDKDVV